MVKLRPLVLLTLILLSLLAPLAAAEKCVPVPRYTDLTILHTNDLHGHLFPFATKVLGVRESDVGGAARRATLIRDIKSATKHALLLMDAGDAFTRGPIGDLEGKPDLDVMNAVGYDVMTLGNNEFKGAEGERGKVVLFDRMKQARFPVLSANVFDKATGKLIASPYIVIERDCIRIGIFGLTAPRTGSYAQAKDFIVKDPIEVAREIVPELRAKCDFLVALTHIGYPLDLELAQAVPGIDVIIGGDSHTWLFQPTLVKWSSAGSPWSVGGTLVCQAGEWGKCLGRLDLRLRRDDTAGSAERPRYEVVSYKSQLIDIGSSTKPASDIERIISGYAKPFEVVAGELAQPVLPPDAAAWVAEAMREAAGADVGTQPVSSVEDGLPAGKVTQLDIRRMFPWPNPAARVTLTGAQLKQHLNETGLAVAGVRTDDGRTLVGGKPVADDATYTVATEDYFALTSPLLSAAPRTTTDRSIREIIASRLAAPR